MKRRPAARVLRQVRDEYDDVMSVYPPTVHRELYPNLHDIAMELRHLDWRKRRLRWRGISFPVAGSLSSRSALDPHTGVTLVSVIDLS